MKKLLEELQRLQNEAVNIVSTIPEKHYHQQFHPDLSPIGWHLGHCIYAESYWVREQLIGKQTIDNSLKSLYVPELSHKPSRSLALPDKTRMLEWATQTQSGNRNLLESELLDKNSHHLLENQYLLCFLIQHYSQHIETMYMVLTEIQLQQLDFEFTYTEKLKPGKPASKTQIVNSGTYSVGSNNKVFAYDNEQPAHFVTLTDYKISSLPVSNSEYLQFINDGGYFEKTCWSEEGWQWAKLTQHKHPHHWRLQDQDVYYGINNNGAYSLEENFPVHGLSYYEAEAFANWCGARLPHEHEWEVASVKKHLQQSGLVWEWCNNNFYPYKNFSAYPYEGYSVPYFDNRHYVLRGGSKYTKERIKHTSFRNYYTADKRHIFAGMRLVYA